MGPLAIRSLIERYLSGKIALPEFVHELSCAADQLRKRGARIPPDMRIVLEEAHALVSGKLPAFGPATSARVLRGLCNDVLDRLPRTDVVPDLAETIAEIRRVSAVVQQRDWIRLDGIVGSLARGHADAFSDVDIAAHWITKPRGLDYITHISRCTQDLSDVLDRPVDIIFMQDLDPQRKERFTRDYVRIENLSHVA